MSVRDRLSVALVHVWLPAGITPAHDVSEAALMATPHTLHSWLLFLGQEGMQT
jgi:hypothetical protein